MAKDGLEALTAILTKTCGDLISGCQRGETEAQLRVNYGHRDHFKEAVRGYVKAYNRANRTGVTVSFPSNFAIRLRAAKKSAR